MNVPFYVRILVRFGKDFGDEEILNDFADSLLRRSRRSTKCELYGVEEVSECTNNVRPHTANRREGKVRQVKINIEQNFPA